MHDESAVHPLTAIGTMLTTFGAAVSHVAIMVAGLALGWLGFYLDLRVRRWIQQHVRDLDRDAPPDR